MGRWTLLAQPRFRRLYVARAIRRRARYGGAGVWGPLRRWIAYRAWLRLSQPVHRARSAAPGWWSDADQLPRKAILIGPDLVRSGAQAVTAWLLIFAGAKAFKRTGQGLGRLDGVFDPAESREASAMVQALRADGPYPEYADKLMLFGRLVGSWDIEGRSLDEAGNVIREESGEWHFEWVLEGRAIADLLIAPPRKGRESAKPSIAYDIAFRVYDPEADVWHVIVVAPIYGAYLNLIAREHGEDIWIEGPGPHDKPIRWVFSNFAEDRVAWDGYFSNDLGATWIHDEVIVLHRRH